MAKITVNKTAIIIISVLLLLVVCSCLILLLVIFFSRDIFPNPTPSSGLFRSLVNTSLLETGLSNEPPSDIPSDIPILDDADYGLYLSFGSMPGFTFEYTTDKELNEVIDFYENELTENGWEFYVYEGTYSDYVFNSSKEKRSLGVLLKSSGGITKVTISEAEEGSLEDY